MSTEKERQSLRLVHTDPRYAEVKSAYNHLYMWIRDGRVDQETNHTLFSRDGFTLHCSMMRSIAMYGNEKASKGLEYFDGSSQIVYTLENLGIEKFLDIVFLTTGKV